MLPLSVAPMMDYTDRHFRLVMRMITRRALLYTEMVTTGALIHGDRASHLDFSPLEAPVALQLGGDDPAALALCAAMGEDWGYDEINLNCGCPSPRVQKGNFGAALMMDPDRVAEAVAAMRAATRLPVTVKHRIGVDHLDRYEDMARFVETVARAGCTSFTVHARLAWLSGLSPKENRTVPPLRYHDVYRLKADYPELSIELNGGVRTLAQATEHLRRVDGVMIGRAATETPMIFAAADRDIFGEQDAEPPTPEIVVERLLPHLSAHAATGDKPVRLLRHLLHLFAGQPGAGLWRRHLTEQAHRGGVEVVTEGLARVAAARARQARLVECATERTHERGDPGC